MKAFFQCSRANLKQRGNKYFTGMIDYRQVVIHMCYIFERYHGYFLTLYCLPKKKKFLKFLQTV